MGMSRVLTQLARVHQCARVFHNRINDQTFPLSYWYYPTSPFVPRRGITAVPRAFDWNACLKHFMSQKKSNTQEISLNKAYYLAFRVKKAKLYN